MIFIYVLGDMYLNGEINRKKSELKFCHSPFILLKKAVDDMYHSSPKYIKKNVYASGGQHTSWVDPQFRGYKNVM